MMEKRKMKSHGKFLKYIIKDPVIFIYYSNKKKYQKNYINFALMKRLQMEN